MSFVIDILTPSSVVAKNLSADSLLIPTEKGEINVLAGHTHIVEKLGTGMMTIFSGANSQKFCMTAGIVKILENKITVLATVSEKQEDINLDRAKSALETAKSKLDKSDDLSEDDFDKYQRKLKRAELRIRMSLMS